MENNEDKPFKCAACRDTGCSLTSDTLQNCTSCGMFEEDNRQMTALQEHLRYLNGIRSEFVGYPGAESVIATLDRSIQNAESLLPKERENLMSAYIDGTGYVINGGVPKKAWFRNKYKPYEK